MKDMIPVVPPKPNKKTKSELSEQSAKYKEAIENQIEKIKSQGLNIGKTALIVGGVAFAGFLLVELFTGFDKKPKNKKAIVQFNPNQISEKKKEKEPWIVSSIKGYILAFLIGIAREKIMEALAELKKDEAKSDI
jgi:hypothetical protein